MKRTLANSSISQKNIKCANSDSHPINNLPQKKFELKNEASTLSANSENKGQEEDYKTTCSLISFFFQNHSNKKTSTHINKDMPSNCIHRLKYKSLDSSSSEYYKINQSCNAFKKANTHISKQQIYQNPSKQQLLRSSSKFNDPQKNETTLIQTKQLPLYNKQYQKLDLQYNRQYQNKKTANDEIELSEKLFSSYNICQQKNKLYKQIAQVRNRKYSYGNESLIQKNNFLETIKQKQFSFRQNKNSIYSTIHSNQGEPTQIYRNYPSQTNHFTNKSCLESIHLYLNHENFDKYQGFQKRQKGFIEFDQSQSVIKLNQSIIHRLDDCIVDKQRGKIDRNKQFIRKSKKDIQILPETDTCIHNSKKRLSSNQLFNNNINKKDKIDSNESIQPLKKRTRFTSLNQCGYTIVSKYNKSEDRKSIMQESNIVFQASKHVKQHQNDNQVSSNFDQRIDSQVINQRNCSSYIQNQIDSSSKLFQNENFIKQKTRNNFIRGKKRNSNKKQEFQLLSKYIKDEQLSIRFDLNLQYQNKCNSQ